jgi:hypothetical protein
MLLILLVRISRNNEGYQATDDVDTVGVGANRGSRDRQIHQRKKREHLASCAACGHMQPEMYRGVSLPL